MKPEKLYASFKRQLKGSMILRIICSFFVSCVVSVAFWMFSCMFTQYPYGYYMQEISPLVFVVVFVVLIFKSAGAFKKQFGIVEGAIKEKAKKLRGNLVARIIFCVVVSAVAGLIGMLASTFLFYNLLLSLIIFIVIFSVTLTVLLKKVASYMKDLVAGVERISKGQYDMKIPETYSDDFGELAARINKMASDLKIAKVRELEEEQRKNDFITSIAHDLRTPLTSITGYLGLISAKDGVSLDNQTILSYADIAYRKSIRLETLINEFFDFSKFTFGEINPQKSDIDLGELLEQLDQEFYPQYNDNNIKSRIIINGNPIVSGDGNMLARVFDNILTNAVRYGSDGKYIDIEVNCPKGAVKTEITNYSSDIKADDLDRIFDKFYRAESSRNSSTGGTGLGLAIGKGIVEAHGGQIFARSFDGKTVLTVILPSNKEHL
ncbi:MAG: HAMP domain-containing sensor histidine kinase [Oscillospiraceae bacterium]